MTRMTVRLPKGVYEELRRVKRKNPHLSLNAVIVEAVNKGLLENKQREAVRA